MDTFQTLVNRMFRIVVFTVGGMEDNILRVEDYVEAGILISRIFFSMFLIRSGKSSSHDGIILDADEFLKNISSSLFSATEEDSETLWGKKAEEAYLSMNIKKTIEGNGGGMTLEEIFNE